MTPPVLAASAVKTGGVAYEEKKIEGNAEKRKKNVAIGAEQ
jgi:hypothetical protein